MPRPSWSQREHCCWRELFLVVCSVSPCIWNEMKQVWQIPISYGFLMQMRLGGHLARFLLKCLGRSLVLYLEQNCNWTDYFLTHSKPFKQQGSHPAGWTWGESGCCWRKSVDSLCKKRMPLMLLNSCCAGDCFSSCNLMKEGSACVHV